MIKWQLFVVLVVGCVYVSIQESSPQDSFYTAGVVEFEPASRSLPSLERLNNNLQAYLEIITSELAKETDIIAFPEGALGNSDYPTYVPDPVVLIAPCDDSGYPEFFQKLSCQARASRKYLVINLTEKEDCNDLLQSERGDPRPCADNGLSIYNTNVVFDRNGAVISRYRKVNLYYEPKNVTYGPNYGHFNTDFGVIFGHFICFDLLFYQPAAEMVEWGITDFIFPTMWFSELPFLSAVQAQQSWAYTNDVNFLAAGASNPSVGSTGTGIYTGRSGALLSAMNSSPTRKLYVAKVPKKGFTRSDVPIVRQSHIRKKRIATSHLNGVLVKRDPGLDSFTTTPFAPSKLLTRLCHGNFCCSFTYRTTTQTPPANTKSYYYRLAAYKGERLYDGIEPLGWSLCTMFACLNSTIDSCGLTFDEDVNVYPEFRLEKMTIEGNFAEGTSVQMMPNSVDDTLMPLTVNDFSFIETSNGNSRNIRYSLLTPKDNLINFGIYVNYFHFPSSAALPSSSGITLLSVIVYLALRNWIN